MRRGDEDDEDDDDGDGDDDHDGDDCLLSIGISQLGMAPPKTCYLLLKISYDIT